MSQQVRPTITNGKTGVGNFGVAIMPDGTSDTLRVLIKPDGFHFESYDFEDLVLPYIALHSPSGSQYTIGFNDTGELLINGVKYVAPTNQGNETIKGNKTYEGQTKLSGGLVINSSGSDYEILVDANGNVKATKISEATGENDGKPKNQ